MRAKSPEHLSFVVVEITILNPPTRDHHHINWLGKIMTDGSKYIAQPTLNFITEGCPLFYLCCDGYRETTLWSL